MSGFTNFAAKVVGEEDGPETDYLACSTFVSEEDCINHGIRRAALLTSGPEKSLTLEDLRKFMPSRTEEQLCRLIGDSTR